MQFATPFTCIKTIMKGLDLIKHWFGVLELSYSKNKYSVFH